MTSLFAVACIRPRPEDNPFNGSGPRKVVFCPLPRSYSIRKLISGYTDKQTKSLISTATRAINDRRLTID